MIDVKRLEKAVSEDELLEEGWYSFEYGDFRFTLDGVVYDSKPVASFGGEGKGDTYWIVFQIGDKFYRRSAYYASWDGIRWEDGQPLEEVEPYQVTETKYKRVGG